MQQTQIQPLGQEDPLEKGMVTSPSIPAWEIPWTEEPAVHRVTKSQTRLVTEHPRTRDHLPTCSAVAAASGENAEF